MTNLSFDDDTLAEARHFNQRLARAPRFKVRNRVIPRLLQGLLRLSQIGGGRKLARRGIKVSRRRAVIDGLSVPVRILRPAGPVRGVILDIHGGGWVLGNAQMDDALNAAMIGACNVAVVSVDYRLAVRAPIEAMIADCLAAARWLLGGGLPEYRDLPVILVGESAGGHLAAAALLRLKAWPDLLRRVKGTILYYGLYDLAGTPSVHQAGPETLVLDGPAMMPALRMLTPGLTDAGRRQPSLSPLYGALDGLPPALLIVGEIDPLRDDTIELARRWAEVGEVEVHRLPEAAHGLIHFPIRMAEQVLAHAHRWIAERLRQGTGAAGGQPGAANARDPF